MELPVEEVSVSSVRPVVELSACVIETGTEAVAQTKSMSRVARPCATLPPLPESSWPTTVLSLCA